LLGNKESMLRGGGLAKKINKVLLINKKILSRDKILVSKIYEDFANG
jgi:hypothetical protein